MYAKHCDKSRGHEYSLLLGFRPIEDAAIFENPKKLFSTVKINPHVGFGFSHHNLFVGLLMHEHHEVLLKHIAEKK